MKSDIEKAEHLMEGVHAVIIRAFQIMSEMGVPFNVQRMLFGMELMKIGSSMIQGNCKELKEEVKEK